MRLDTLRVFHLSKSKAQALPRLLFEGLRDFEKHSFCLETCQRWIWIWNSQRFTFSSSEIEEIGQDESVEFYRGQEAYLFLLRLSAGLESEIVGETDVFGQIKEAWRKANCTGSSSLIELSPWIQKIFEDTKEIRSRYLQNLGGASYGSLIRKLFQLKTNLPSRAPVFLLGAGQIAQSIAPFLLDSELWLWNRDSSRLRSFYSDLSSQHPGCRIQLMETPEKEKKAWMEASHVIVGIPLDSKRDPERIKWFQEGNSRGCISNRTIIHLGGMKNVCGQWDSLSQFYCLDDLFALQGNLENIRLVQITQAEKACRERAILRKLGGSLSIPHGWEDLASFVSFA